MAANWGRICFYNHQMQSKTETHNNCPGDGSVVTAFFRSFMTRSNTNYRTALVAPTANDSIREAHSYEYDNNCNEVFIVTPRSGAKDNPVSPDRLDTLKIVKTNKYEAYIFD
jgi:hypothetical protein